MTCSQYLNPFISFAGGYLTNPDATASCNFCSVSSADQFLASGFNIFYDHAWRNFGFMVAYIAFNVCSLILPFSPQILTNSLYLQIAAVYIAYYLFRVRTGSLLPSFGKKKSHA